MADRKWHAVYTRPGKEKKVADSLTKKKIANYLPLYKSECLLDGRKKSVYGPLFPGYVFISLTGDERNILKQSGDIISFVYWQQCPAVIQNDEINAIKLFLSEYSCTRLEDMPVIPQEHFRINNELRLQKRGNVVEANVATVKLMLPSLGRVLVAEVRKEKTEDFILAKDLMMRNIIES